MADPVELFWAAQAPSGPSYARTALDATKNGVDQSYTDLGYDREATAHDETLDLYAKTTLRTASQVSSDPAYSQSLLGSSNYGVDQTTTTLGYYYRATGVAGSAEATVSPNSVSSEESVGAPHFNVVQTVAPESVLSAESLGSPVLVQEQFVGPSSIESTESVGNPSPGFPQPVDPIPSGEQFGEPVIKGGRPPQPPPVRPPHQPGQGSIWFDHVPFAPVEPRQHLGCNLADFSAVRIELTIGQDLLLFMGGPQSNGFVVPEVRAADVELVPVTFAGVGGKRVMY
jgi:hypothetical protein